jgi:hypothetical protein
MKTLSIVLLALFAIAMVLGVATNLVSNKDDKQVLVGVTRLFEWGAMFVGAALALVVLL